jgi:hypothetical protein
MGYVSMQALARNLCRKKAYDIVEATIRYLRNGGRCDLLEGDRSRVNEAYVKLEKLRNTYLTRAEHESHKQTIKRAVQEAIANKRGHCIVPNVVTIHEYSARCRAWGLGPVNRPRTMPR